jgi:thiamine pyrophosphate-dependent acetolactate synthase large subunit-like protein
MISSVEAFKALIPWRGDAVVVAASTALRYWSVVSGRRELDVDLSDAMGRAPSVALGIALAQAGRKVLVLDTDSALRTNLDSLVTVGALAPKNLAHFLLEDSTNLSTGGVPIPGLGRINYSGLAEDAGYSRTYQFDNLEDLVLNLEDVMQQAGPTLVLLKVTYDSQLPGYPSRTTGESLAAVKEALRLGI